MAQAPQRLTQGQIAQSGGASAPQARRSLNKREKAAVIVRLLVAEGSPLAISALPEHMQAALAEQMGQMRLVDRATLAEVVAEFLAELEEVGLSFPGGIEGAITMMDGHISATAASRLRRLAGASARADPWDRLMALPIDRLLPVVEAESIEVSAVMLSKLPVPKAAELLGLMPGEKARRVAYAVSLTSNVDPETVRRIGKSLASQLDSLPARAFESDPVARVGAILNIAPHLTREEVLAGLDEDDAGFAEKVRRAIFTFAHIPARLPPRDVPKVARMVEQPVMITALAAALRSPDTAAAAEFLLANLSQRMAQSLRDEVAAITPPKGREAEAALNAIVLAIRGLETTGELVLTQPEDP
jgi:flagellar motor switch protein FliG